MRRREEGRCFHCGGAYSPGHCCPEKNLRVIICAEEEGGPTKGNQGLLWQMEDNVDEEEEEKEHPSHKS